MTKRVLNFKGNYKQQNFSLMNPYSLAWLFRSYVPYNYIAGTAIKYLKVAYNDNIRIQISRLYILKPIICDLSDYR